MTMNTRHLLVMGGTFDPVHFGHTRLAQEAADKLDVAEIRLIPSLTPPHRGQPCATAVQRLAMLKLAVAARPIFNVDHCEIERGGMSFSIDTLRALRGQLSSDSRIYFLMGYDAYQKLPGWKHWQNLLDYAHIVVLARSVNEYNLSVPMRDLEARCKVANVEALQRWDTGRIAYLPLDVVDISASAIREKLKAGDRPTGLMADAVIDYIFDESLYGIRN